jgi:hypothetical protein
VAFDTRHPDFSWSQAEHNGAQTCRGGAFAQFFGANAHGRRSSWTIKPARVLDSAALRASLHSPIRQRQPRTCIPLSDFVVIVRRRGAASTWGWSIHRRSRHLGVKFYEDGFKTWDEAKLAGEAALKEFLTAVACEGE